MSPFLLLFLFSRLNKHQIKVRERRKNDVADNGDRRKEKQKEEEDMRKNQTKYHLTKPCLCESIN